MYIVVDLTFMVQKLWVIYCLYLVDSFLERSKCLSEMFHVTTSFHGFSDQDWSFMIMSVSDINYVWCRNDCMVYMSVWHVSSNLDLSFTVHKSILGFWVLVCYSNTLCNRGIIFGMGKYFTVHVSLAGFILPWPHFHCSLFNVIFCVIDVFFLYYTSNTQLYMRHIMIVRFTWLSYWFHLTLTSFPWCID